MELEILPYRLTVCKVKEFSAADLGREFFFMARTDGEASLVCRTEDVPPETLRREDGWRGFRVAGVLDFSLTGVMARISGILAEAGISIFAVSTYDTDYVLVKEESFGRAMHALESEGYAVTE